ncbi:hypothetical protein [Enterobacter kobei]|uniref:hypothetical protein n=1 Tax=Enterobacter kobei TaxID=208224 RepID=UPI0038901186
MSTITKERLEQLANFRGAPVTRQEEQELARIALASLEAEPVAYIFKHPAGRLFWSLTDESNKGQSDVMPVYTAPPAPVALPSGYSDFEEIWSSSTHPLTQDDEMKDFAWDIWNACRAAMLQGADGALTDEDAKRVDELVMWIKRLAHSLRKANPDSKLQSDAMDYLSRKGLIGVEDILR